MKRKTKIRSFTRRLPFALTGSSFSTFILIAISFGLMVASVLRPATFTGLRASATDFFEPSLSFVSYPFQRMTLFFYDVTNLAQLQADNERLEQENIRLKEWYQTALLLNSENRSLRALLDLNIDPQYNHLAARVLSDAGNTYAKSLLVKAGALRGVRKGAAVLSGDGLVGRVIEVGTETSRVLLVIDINSRVPVMVEGTSHHAVMAGSGNENPYLIHFPQDIGIPEGSRIVTSGYGGVYPRGLPVGRVKKGRLGRIEILTFSDFSRLHIVRVLRSRSE